jgi:hypothetical protein
MASINIEEPYRMKMLSHGLSQFSLVAHFLGGQRYHLAVAPNVERQSQTSMFIDDFFNSFFECISAPLLFGDCKPERFGAGVA